MRSTRRAFAILTLAGVVALLFLSGDRQASAHHQTGKYNSMKQMKTVEPCTAQTTLTKTGPATAEVGETITYTITETNNATGTCLLDTNGDTVLDTLRVVGTYVLENRSGASAGHSGNPCNPLDPRETCVLNVLDWVETHTAGAGNTWNVLTTTAGGATTRSGNQLDGQRNVDAYCPTDSSGPMPDLNGDGNPGGGNTLDPDKCAPSAQPKYGTLTTSLASPQSLPCGQGAGSSCFDAPQTYAYTLTVAVTATQAAWLASCTPGAPTGSCDGIRNVVHFDMFNEQLTSSGRNHFARASFTGASLDSNAYNVTITDTPQQAPNPASTADDCTPIDVFTTCGPSGSSWVADGATLAGGQTGKIEVKYEVREDDCGTTITNTATATHTDASGQTTSHEGPVAALTEVGDCGVVAEVWTAHSQGFWRSPNGPGVYDADANGSLDTGGVSIGGVNRGKAVTTNGDANTILDGVGNPTQQAASCTLVAGNNNCTPLDTGVSRGDLTKAMTHTLALELNIKYLNAGNSLNATLGSIDEPKCPNGDDDAQSLATRNSLVTLGLAANNSVATTGAVTIGGVRTKANDLINHSGTNTLVVVTSAQLTAMIQVLGGCVNTNHAVVPGDRDWDGVPEDIDVCPGIYDPGQEDVDGDGIGDACDTEMDGDSRTVTVGGRPVFDNDAEAYMGIDWRRDCGLDAWGPDFNGDGAVDIFDVADMKAHYGTSASTGGAYANRNDLSADGYINILDLAIMKRFFLESCQGVDPIQPGAP